MRTTKTTGLAAIAGMGLMLAGCGGSPTDPAANSAAVAGYVPPATRAPTPLPGQGHTTPLTAYVGHYPRDAVGGVAFFDRTEVATTLRNAVGDETIRQAIVRADGPATPIFRAGTGIASWGCAAHDCSARNWTLFVVDDARKGRACYHDADTMGETSRWYEGAAPVTRPGGCPSETPEGARTDA